MWYKDLANTDQAYASSCESISFKFTSSCEKNSNYQQSLKKQSL